MLKFVVALSLALLSSVSLGNTQEVSVTPQNGYDQTWNYGGYNCNRLAISEVGTGDWRVVNKWGMVGEGSSSISNSHENEYGARDTLIDILEEANGIPSGTLTQASTVGEFLAYINTAGTEMTLMPNNQDEDYVSYTHPLSVVDVLYPSQCFQYSKLVDGPTSMAVKYVSKDAIVFIDEMPDTDS